MPKEGLFFFSGDKMKREERRLAPSQGFAAAEAAEFVARVIQEAEEGGVTEKGGGTKRKPSQSPQWNSVSPNRRRRGSRNTPPMFVKEEIAVGSKKVEGGEISGSRFDTGNSFKMLGDSGEGEVDHDPGGESGKVRQEQEMYGGKVSCTGRMVQGQQLPLPRAAAAHTITRLSEARTSIIKLRAPVLEGVEGHFCQDV